MNGWLKLIEQDETTLPIDLERVKMHLRVDSNEEDDLIRSFILGAVREIERQTSRGLFPALFEWRMDDWPESGQELPWGPIRNIEQVGWVDAAGDAHELPASQWEMVLSDRGAKILLNGSLPQPGRSVDGVYIRFWAGHEPAEATSSEGNGWLAMPGSAVVAMLLMVAHWYRNRETVSGDNLKEIPLGAAQMLSGLKIWR